jgi:hypothetical protein
MNMQHLHSFYHMDTDVLLTLDVGSSHLYIEYCRESKGKTIKLSETKFSLIYLLWISHPEVVPYDEFIYTLTKVGIDVRTTEQLHTKISALKKKLITYGVCDFIVNVRNRGYVISPNWVIPKDNAVRAPARAVVGLNRWLPKGALYRSSQGGLACERALLHEK